MDYFHFPFFNNEVVWTFSFACDIHIFHPNFVLFKFRSLGYATEK